MTIRAWLRQTEKVLAATSSGTARLDALVLLEDCLNTNRAQLLAEPDRQLTPAQQTRLAGWVRRRATHEPLAYIRGKTEFYGREFIITSAVLEPRPESEAIIELLKALPDLRRTMRGADVGTGSGALGITATIETGLQMDLLDIDANALAVARRNVNKFTTGNRIIKSDLVRQATGPYDILLCNLPYVPDDFKINPAAKNEPRIAIFGGPDGLNVYRRLFAQLSKLSDRPRYVLTESLPPQHTKLVHVAEAAGYQQDQADDFVQLFVTN